MKRRNFIALLIAVCVLICGLFGCSQNVKDGEQTEKEEEPAAYTVTEMYVPRGELEIYCKLYTPTCAEGDLPAVILSHSALLTSDSMKSYAVGFAERGFVACALDFCGGSKSSKSTSADMTIFTEVDDLKAVISAVAALDGVDETTLYLFGTSQGGLVSALTANDCAAEISKLILLYPAFNIPENVQGITYNALYGLIGYGKQFIETLQDYDAYSHIADFTNPVLIIHGTADTTVDISYSRRAAEVYANCALKEISGANHGFNSENTYGLGGDFDDSVWEYVDEFLCADIT